MGCWLCFLLDRIVVALVGGSALAFDVGAVRDEGAGVTAPSATNSYLLLFQIYNKHSFDFRNIESPSKRNDSKGFALARLV
jgi:hypothetical protein